MVVHKVWFGRPPGRPTIGSYGMKVRWEGWFLLGFIPLYVRQRSYLEPIQ